MPIQDEVARIPYDDVEFDDDLALVNGAAFSGVIFELHSDGQLATENIYRDGLPDGLQQRWFPNGQLKERAIAVRGKGASQLERWYSNGQQQLFRQDKNSRPIVLREWSEDGMLVTDKTFEVHDPQRSLYARLVYPIGAAILIILALALVVASMQGI